MPPLLPPLSLDQKGTFLMLLPLQLEDRESPSSAATAVEEEAKGGPWLLLLVRS